MTAFKCPLCGMYNNEEDWSKEEYKQKKEKAKRYKMGNIDELLN